MFSKHDQLNKGRSPIYFALEAFGYTERQASSFESIRFQKVILRSLLSITLFQKQCIEREADVSPKVQTRRTRYGKQF